MRPSSILARLRAGQIARVCSTSHFLPFMPALAAHFGYDGIWIDAEHGNWDPSQTKTMLALTKAANIDGMFRSATLEKSGLARLLEEGASGLMIPHVSTGEKARHIADCAKFPPMGDRGIDGAGIDADFWIGKSSNYTDEANDQTFVCVQIETPQALANVDEIAGTKGVDILFLGPGDMSLRLQCQPSLRDPVLLDAFQRIVAACRKHGKFAALPVGDGEMAKKAAEVGANLIAFGGEFFAIHDKLQSCANALDAALGESRSVVSTKPIIYQR